MPGLRTQLPQAGRKRHSLNQTIAEYIPTDDFDTELFGQIVESITVISRNTLRFCLAGGLTLTEKFEKRSA